MSGSLKERNPQTSDAGDPRVMDAGWTFLATPAGRLAMVAAYTALLAVNNAAAWPAVALGLVVTSLLPQHRRVILAIATIGVVAFSPPLDLDRLGALASWHFASSWMRLWPFAVIATLAFGCAYVELVRRRPKSIFARRPVLILVIMLTALLLVAGNLPITGSAWFAVTSFSMCLASYLWFFAYAASETKLRGAPPATAQLGYWRPFWGFSNVPIGKGAAYLERVEARDAETLARVQLRGLQLMAWCTVLFLVMNAFRFAVYAPHGPFGGVTGRLLWWLPPAGLPPIPALLEYQARGEPFPFATRWASMLAEFVMTVLHMTTWGNSIVATCRMAGYDAAPNTDRPLLSTSIAEFYNRFYFYFKELLATFFFYPTYLGFFRSQPKVRLFVATVMAAGFGNFLFHFFRDSDRIYSLGFFSALFAYRTYALYALILGVGIAVSQVRLLARHRRPPQGLRRAGATLGVLFFYCLLGLLDVQTPYNLSDYAAVYLSLFVP